MYEAKEAGPNGITVRLFISSNLNDGAVIVTDVGQHQMWTAQAYPFPDPVSF
ncbi:hypothetical protein DSCO28_69800 [Desulfosarcina ovata subsp. sediminis]|uniref:Uncharacterized protein n=1 Tax=Desulfosarcina ovata subsp. sediminis TaxID=885957 RepID=A0A5K8A269_9BACT|nr:hypothetical protein [Desulfosarcina ovata]BBO86414.1 hypothetical protein DSCO28_69800 [Desulfosarcina ovata subsp. sediminis]